MANQIVTNAQAVIMQEPTIQPLHDRILVLRIQEEPRSSLIWIPDIAQENTKRAKVLAVGNEVKGVNPGDIVLLPGIASKHPDWEQSDIMLVQEADIGGTFN